MHARPLFHSNLKTEEIYIEINSKAIFKVSYLFVCLKGDEFIIECLQIKGIFPGNEWKQEGRREGKEIQVANSCDIFRVS